MHMGAISMKQEEEDVPKRQFRPLGRRASQARGLVFRHPSPDRDRLQALPTCVWLAQGEVFRQIRLCPR